ncbi:MAG: Ppx/GppA family phosphatase [Christensenellaceae bacterium]|jgi:exopolyphosphatase/guanosine-5'-triphosphate,3'-diphosphate pyrophosphatase|nr:Ppx/GppA family phosphatase [Christensenellaceae bacterium]
MEKIAIIDLGSNTVRMVIARAFDEGYFTIADELKEQVRLIKDLRVVDDSQPNSGFLQPVPMAQAINVLKNFKTLYQRHNVTRVLAYATSAVRNAKNKDVFIKNIKSETGIDFSVLSQEEEADLVYTGVIRSMDINRALIIDIGGGSVKLIQVGRKQILNQEALPYGAVTLFEKVQKMAEKTDSENEEERLKAERLQDPEERSKEYEKIISEYLVKISFLTHLERETLIVGVGGSIRNLGKISRRIRKEYPLNAAHNYGVSRDELTTIYDTTRKLTEAQLQHVKGLTSARADIFPAALAILSAIFTHCGQKYDIKELRISGRGMREGAMFKYLEHSGKVTNNTEDAEIEIVPDISEFSVKGMIERYDVNVEHAEHVYKLAEIMYRYLRVVHKLPKQYIKYLKIAAMLHDCGCAINYYNHTKHGMYLILNSDMCGLTQKELFIIAIAVGLHGVDSMADIEAQKYTKFLTEDDVLGARKLGIILRMAEALDRSGSRVIKDITCEILGDNIIFMPLTEQGVINLERKASGEKLIADNDDITLEIRDIRLASREFREIFGKTLDVAVNGNSGSSVK